jgi:hypothetical protein
MRLPLTIRKSFVFCVAVLFVGAGTQLHAQATLLLEEPYSYDGTFAGTGHAAVYLARVCAESPIALRRCGPGEKGVVISRYNGVAGRDWIAIPLIPYLYAVNNAEDIPLFADSKLVAFLRHEYLTSIDVRGAASYQLAGSAYDRTTYGFRIATRPEQDDEFIRLLNSEANRESYRLLNRNCADFAKQVINFYYPKAIHRSILADVGVMTPKQAAKSLAHFSKRHPEMQLTTFIIPQVPGLKRSKPVHGVIESLVLAKKYVTPVLLFHPFVVGTVEAAYWAGWRFDPGKGALIFNPSSNPSNGLETPLTSAQRRSYLNSISALKRASADTDSVPDWRRGAEPQLDATGQPFLKAQVEGRIVQLGLSRGNALRLSAPPELVQGLLLTRLEEELKPSKPSRVSGQQAESDWKLLQGAVEARQAALNSGATGTVAVNK